MAFRSLPKLIALKSCLMSHVSRRTVEFFTVDRLNGRSSSSQPTDRSTDEKKSKAVHRLTCIGGWTWLKGRRPRRPRPFEYLHESMILPPRTVSILNRRPIEVEASTLANMEGPRILRGPTWHKRKHPVFLGSKVQS